MSSRSHPDLAEIVRRITSHPVVHRKTRQRSSLSSPNTNPSTSVALLSVLDLSVLPVQSYEWPLSFPSGGIDAFPPPSLLHCASKQNQYSSGFTTLESVLTSVASSQVKTVRNSPLSISARIRTLSPNSSPTHSPPPDTSHLASPAPPPLLHLTSNADSAAAASGLCHRVFRGNIAQRLPLQ